MLTSRLTSDSCAEKSMAPDFLIQSFEASMPIAEPPLIRRSRKNLYVKILPSGVNCHRRNLPRWRYSRPRKCKSSFIISVIDRFPPKIHVPRRKLCNFSFPASSGGDQLLLGFHQCRLPRQAPRSKIRKSRSDSLSFLLFLV